MADVRELVERHPPEQYRRKPTWQHVPKEIAKAADGDKDLLEGRNVNFKAPWNVTMRRGRLSG